MKKTAVKILSALLMLSMVFSTNVFAANEETTSAWDSFLGFIGVAASNDVGVEYRGHIQDKGNFPLDGTWIQGPNELGTRGQFLRMEGFWIQLEDEPADLNIKYNVHVQNEGWLFDEDDTTNWAENGEFCGTEAKMQRIEAVKIVLVDDEGDLSIDYDVLYQGHVQDVGDLPKDGSWFENGEQLGTVASSLRLEALKVKIVQKEANLDAYEAALAAVTQADYTAASWTAYKAIVDANVVDADNLQSEVNAATAAIEAAQLNLVKVLKVESVSAINGKQVEVTFNKDVTGMTFTKANFTVTQAGDPAGQDRFTDSTTATNIVAGATAGTGVLQNAGNKVILTVDSGAKMTNGKTITIKTIGLTDMADDTKTAVLADTTVPTIVKAESKASNQIRVTFTEPVWNNTDNFVANQNTPATNFTINDGAVVITTAVRDEANPNAVVITTSGNLTAGTAYTVKVNTAVNANEIQDFTGYKVMQNAPITFTHVADTTLPTVTGQAVGEKTVRITFDRPVTIPFNANIEYRYGYNATGANKVVGNAATLVNDTVKLTARANTNNAEYDIKDFAAMAPGAGIMYINYTVPANAAKTNVITDGFGNVLPSGTAVSFTVVEDMTAPTATVEYKTATTIDVKYNKAVTGATNASNYEVKNPLGQAVAISNIAVIDASINHYRLTVATMEAGGNFTVGITDGIKDTTVNQNKFVPQTFTIVAPDTKAPTLSNTSGVVGNSTLLNSDVLYLYYSETMGASALDASNYRLVTAANAQYNLPAGTVITQTAATVKITLPKTIAGIATDLSSAALTQLFVGGVKDVAGNTVAPMENKAINAAANFAATATKVSLKSDTQVSFEVNRQLKAVDAAKLQIGGVTAATSASIVNNADGTATVTATFPAATLTTAVTGQTVNALVDAFTDLNDVKSLAVLAQAITIDRAAPALVSTITNGAAGNITSLDVTYSENIYPASVIEADYTIEGYTITGVSVAGSVVTVNVASKLNLDSGVTPKITQVGSVEDDITINANQPTRNVLGAQAGVTPTDGVAPVVSGTPVITEGIAGAWGNTLGDKVVITFSEAIAPGTLNIAGIAANGNTSAPIASPTANIFAAGKLGTFFTPAAGAAIATVQSTVNLDSTGTIVTVNVTTVSGGVVTSPAGAFTRAGTITDLAGN